VKGDVLSVEKLINAPAASIFALVADASEHPRIDGSGTVKQTKPGAPQQLSLGSTFGMSMKLGIGYSTVNTVVEFETDRRIAWQTRPPGLLGRFVGGQIWRFEFQPKGENATLVRESWDLSQNGQRSFLKLGPFPDRTREGMTKTLERIEDLAASRP
jgi:Polyketide cyclase / dehydrase and lipid transport